MNYSIGIPRTIFQEKQHQKLLMSENWHTRTMAQMKDKSNEELFFIVKDANEASIAAMQNGDFKKEGQYLDERHYANMEIRERMDYYK